MGPAFVQGAGGTATTGSTALATIAQAYTAANTAGSLLALITTWDSTSGTGDRLLIDGVTDTQGNTWAQVAAPTNDTTNGQATAMWYASNCKAGANTVTVTFDGPRQFRQLEVAEFSGLATTSPLDVTHGQAAAGTTAANNITSGTATTTAAGELIVGGYVNDDTTSTIAAGTGFTKNVDTFTDHSMILESLVQGSPAAVAATFTKGTAGRYLAIVAAFKAAAGTAAAGSAAVTLTGAGTGRASGTGSAVVTLTGSGAAAPSGPAGGAVLTLAGTGAARSAATGTAVLSITAAGATRAAASGTATLTLTASATAGTTKRFVAGVSGNGRYFIDQLGDPILIHGDSAWSMTGRLTATTAETYFANRETNGFNATIIELISYGNSGGPNDDGTTFDGIAPFVSGNITNLNATYWARVDAIMASAAAHGITVFAMPMDNQNTNLGSFASATTTQITTYANTVAARYASAPNIVWLGANDYQDQPAQDTRLNAILTGLRQVDTRPFSLEISYPESTTTLDSFWEKADFSCAYSYYPTYRIVLDAYNVSWTTGPTTKPVVMFEANYEGENIGQPGTGAATTNETLRRQLIWTLTCGGSGEFYGNTHIWQFDGSWTTSLTTTMVTQAQHLRAWFETVAWHTLVPDQANTLVTAGRGTPVADNSEMDVLDSDYVTAAQAGTTLAVIYMPTGSANTITVDMSKLGSTPSATWVDPSDTTATTPATVGATYTRPGTNADGNSDWLLLLQATSSTPATGSATITLAGAGTASKPAGGAAALTLTAAGTGHAQTAGGANLSLTATGTGQAPVTGSATITLTAAGAGSLPAAGTAMISLTSGGTVQVPTGGTASLSPTATGTSAAATAGMAALTVTAIGTASLPATSPAALELTAAGTTTAPTTATATISLAAAGSAAAPVIGAAALTLAAAGIIGNNIVGTASLDLTATGTAIASAVSTALLSLTATGTADTPVSSLAVLTLLAAGTGLPGGTTTGTANLDLTAAGTPAAPTSSTAALDLHATGTASTVTATAGTATLTLTAAGIGSGGEHDYIFTATLATQDQEWAGTVAPQTRWTAHLEEQPS